MGKRERDLIEKREELEKLLAGEDSEALLGAAERSSLALQFRATDSMIGLETIPDAIIELVEDLTIKAYYKAIELGRTECRREMARFLVGRNRTEQALSVLIAGAKEGDSAAATEASEMLWHSRDESRYDEAFRLATAGAANDPEGRANYLLGLYYFNGAGVEADQTVSFGHHRTAADAGDADAMFELSVMLKQGLGTEPDPEAALTWCRKAADAEQPRAQYNLGAFHATGSGVPRDMAESVKWYALAAHNGHGRAAATLGVMYALGSGVDVDDNKAKRFFELAEDSGFDWQAFAGPLGVELAKYDPET
jgi:TPR repeat protein